MNPQDISRQTAALCKLQIICGVCLVPAAHERAEIHFHFHRKLGCSRVSIEPRGLHNGPCDDVQGN